MMIYEERKTQLSEGEKLVWLKTDNTAQGKHNKIKNGLSGTAEKINGDQITVRTELGHTVMIQGEGAYITNAQVITGHKSQGATEHTGLLSVSSTDRLATQNMMYVLATRQTQDLVAFVDDKEKLIEALRAETKTSSLEEQRELLQNLTDQLKSSVEKEEQLSGHGKVAGDDLVIQDEKTSDRQRQVAIENNQVNCPEGGRDGQTDHKQEQQQDDHSAHMAI